MSSRTTALMGPPGSGKTTMACLTAFRKPVHAIDADRKILSQGNLRNAIDKKELTVREVDEPLVEVALDRRVRELATNTKMTKDPNGWIKFAQLVEELKTDADAQAAGTWFVDSWTRVNAHLLRHLMRVSDNKSGNMRPQDWGALLQMSQESMTILIDLARQYDKDLIVSVHERFSEIPKAGGKVMMKQQGDMRTRDYVTPMDVKVAASVQGQFGNEFGAYFNEVYSLRVDMDGDKPRWVCRVHPDGVRDLRTSFMLTQSEFEPDFRKIWK